MLQEFLVMRKMLAMVGAATVLSAALAAPAPRQHPMSRPPAVGES